MSQNRTIVPGMDFESLGSNQSADFYNDLYRPTGSNPGRTYIPGSPDADSQYENVGAVQNRDLPASSSSRRLELQERVVVGILFSNSKGLLGEIFPLYLGRNLIGNADNCDICLKEATVSPEHAVIYIRKEGSPDLYSISISDYGSRFGTTVNDTDARYETVAIEEKDVLTIGRHYKFILKIFNAENAGLDEDPEFQEIRDYNEINAVQSGPQHNQLSNDFYAPSGKADESTRTIIS